MRGSAAAAALAAHALLAASACKPSSLTPGWISERGPETLEPSAAAPGLWEGMTSEGDFVRFQVAGGFVQDLTFWRTGTCPRILQRAEPEPIEAGVFLFTIEIDSGGFFSVEGSFPNAEAATGTFSYSGIAIQGTCPRAGAGSFTAFPVQ